MIYYKFNFHSPFNYILKNGLLIDAVIVLEIFMSW